MSPEFDETTQLESPDVPEPLDENTRTQLGRVLELLKVFNSLGPRVKIVRALSFLHIALSERAPLIGDLALYGNNPQMASRLCMHLGRGLKGSRIKGLRLVTSEVHATDGRLWHVRLTPKGAKVARRVCAIMDPGSIRKRRQSVR